MNSGRHHTLDWETILNLLIVINLANFELKRDSLSNYDHFSEKNNRKIKGFYQESDKIENDYPNIIFPIYFTDISSLRAI